MDQITVVDNKYYKNNEPVINKIIWHGNQFKYIDGNGMMDNNPQLTQKELSENFQAQFLEPGQRMKITMWGNPHANRLVGGGMRRRNKRSNKRSNKSHKK